MRKVRYSRSVNLHRFNQTILRIVKMGGMKYQEAVEERGSMARALKRKRR